eukprot:g12316.t1
MPSDVEHSRRTLLDAARVEPARRERRRLLLASFGYMAVFAFSAFEILYQSLSKRIVNRPEWWFAWIVFGAPAVMSLWMSVSRFLVARSLGDSLSGWSRDSLSRLPPNIARLVGLTPPDSSRRPRGFALAGGLFVGGQGGDLRAGTEMTTPEVLRSTSLRSRSSVRNATSTPQQGTGVGAITPARGTPSERRLFSPEDSGRWAGKGGAAAALCSTPAELAKAGRRAIAVRPEDVDGMIKGYDERHAKAKPAEASSAQGNAMLGFGVSADAIADAGHMQGFQGNAVGLGFGGGAGGANMAMQGRGGYYGMGNSLGGDAGGWGGGGEGGASWAYQVYEPDSAEVGQGRGQGHEGDATDKDQAKQLLVRLGIADKTDDFTMNAKVYVVNLIKRYLSEFSKVCSLLEERGVSPAILRQEIHRQPQLRVRTSPRAFVNLSLKDMAAQFSNQQDFWVEGADGQQTSLFREYQALEEALHVTAGAGTAGAGNGNPAYVLSRLRVLSDDEFMSAFEYAGGSGYPANRDWGPDLPTDAAIVMRLFVCCSDELLPRAWEDDRPFARQFFVDREPSREDALPGRFFLARNGVLHPPHFFVVANQEKWNILPGSTNVFQAIALFFYAIKMHKSSYLGTGISVANIVQEIFGGVEAASGRDF